MARAGAVVAETLALLEEHIQPGVTTGELDAIAEEFIRSHGGEPTFKGYKGYPAATCLSPNAWSSTASRARSKLAGRRHPLGRRRRHARRASSPTRPGRSRSGRSRPRRSGCSTRARRRSRRGSTEARVGNTIGDISQAVQTVTEAAGFSVIRSLVGHGVGRSMHEDPQVPNFVSSYRGPELKEGMTIAIEPMITAGGPDVYIHDDEWSISTSDGSLAAHFEHTVAVTADGPADPDTGNEGPGTMTTRVARRMPACASLRCS